MTATEPKNLGELKKYYEQAHSKEENPNWFKTGELLLKRMDYLELNATNPLDFETKIRFLAEELCVMNLAITNFVT